MYVVLSDDVVYDVSNYDVIYTIQWEDLFLLFFFNSLHLFSANRKTAAKTPNESTRTPPIKIR